VCLLKHSDTVFNMIVFCFLSFSSSICPFSFYDCEEPEMPYFVKKKRCNILTFHLQLLLLLFHCCCQILENHFTLLQPIKWIFSKISPTLCLYENILLCLLSIVDRKHSIVNRSIEARMAVRMMLPHNTGSHTPRITMWEPHWPPTAEPSSALRPHTSKSTDSRSAGSLLGATEEVRIGTECSHPRPRRSSLGLLWRTLVPGVVGRVVWVPVQMRCSNNLRCTLRLVGTK